MKSSRVNEAKNTSAVRTVGRDVSRSWVQAYRDFILISCSLLLLFKQALIPSLL